MLPRRMLVAERNFTMVPFAGGLVVVGSDTETARERPAHEVELDAYAIGDRCVTAGGYLAFLLDDPGAVDHSMIDCIDPCFVVHRAGGFELRPSCAGFPMIQVSWWGAAAYCNWLSRAEGLQPVYDVAARYVDLDRDGYRLPTEAEWEAACRAGHPGGTAASGVDADTCNTADAGPACRALRAGETGAGGFLPGHPSPVPVASFPPDAAGLHEMLGNVREWCHDRYAAYEPVAGRAERNPAGAGRGAFRVVRGGSFADPAVSVSPSSRGAAFEDTKCEVYGFRVARRL